MPPSTPPHGPGGPQPDPEVAPAAELSSALAAGRLSAGNLLESCLERLGSLDRCGPALRSVISLDPSAADQAARADARRRGGEHGALLGIPVLVKDNIDVAGCPTTAGSLALGDAPAGADAPLVARLRRAGVVLLGKANLTEWANFMAHDMPSGYSAAGGQTLNPYDTSITPSGSSSGSAVAVAAGIVPLSIGTETNGSILSPSRHCSVVGVKPTVGLVSRAGVVPISPTQDTAGPMARTVRDAAALLSVIAGPDPADPATAGAPEGTDYTSALEVGAAAGARIGVVDPGELPAGDRSAWQDALGALRHLGAELVEVDLGGSTSGGVGVLVHELAPALAAYLARPGCGTEVRSLAEVVAYNAAHPDEELKFGQARLEAALAVDHADPDAIAAYEEARRADLAYSRDSLDAAFGGQGVEALLFANETSCDRGARAGYPSVCAPAGYSSTHRRPVAITLLGPAWSEVRLLALAYAFEQATLARRAPWSVNPAAYRPRAFA